MPDSTKRNVLGIRVDAVDYTAAGEAILAAARDGRGLSVSALAVHGVMTGVLDPSHRYRLNSFDIIAPDGQPVRWALNVLYRSGLPERVYGPTLMLRVCGRAEADGLPVYLYGSRPEVLERLQQNLLRMHPRLVIAGAQPSRFRQLTPAEKQQVAEKIRESGARITFVGLGCPRQEVWAYEFRDALSMPIVAVGAAFDFHAGTLLQAPEFLQKRGLEWAYRLAREPRRLWKRYLLLNPMYLYLLGLQALRLRAFDNADTDVPLGELRYG